MDLQHLLQSASPDVLELNRHLVPQRTGRAATTEPRRPDTELEAKFADTWRMLTNNEPLLRDYVFAPDVKGYELDFYHEGARVGVEVNGGTWAVGGHSTGTGISRDYQKTLLAATRGIMVLSVSADMLTQENIVLTVDSIWRVIRERSK